MDQKAYLLGLYEKSMPNTIGWRERLLAARHAGFDFLELSIDETDARLARLEPGSPEAEEILSAVASTGFPIRTMCLSGHRKYPLGSRNPSVRARSLDIMEKAVCLACQLGIRVIQLAGYDVYYEAGGPDTVQYFQENLKKCIAMASRMGVMLAFETMETPFMDTVEKADFYVRQIRSPYLNIYPDIGNLTNASRVYGNSVLSDLKRGAGHLAAAHLKETIPGVYREVPFGTGHTDFKRCTETLMQMGVRLFVGEFWYAGETDWPATLRESNLFLRRYLDAAQASLIPSLG